MKTQSKTQTGQKTRQRTLSRSSNAIFTHAGWRVWRFDEKNIALIHEKEGSSQIRYYSTLGGALAGLVKQIGFVCSDLNDCMEKIDSLHKDIARAGI